MCFIFVDNLLFSSSSTLSKSCRRRVFRELQQQLPTTKHSAKKNANKGLFEEPLLDLDQRQEAWNVFTAYVDVVRNSAAFEGDTIRVPIAVNTGTTDSGKAYQL